MIRMKDQKQTDLFRIRANVRRNQVHQPISFKLMREGGRFLLIYLCALFVIMFSLPAVSFAETYVSGNITADTTWTLEGSPYMVTGDVTVRYSGYNSSTATLTIEPGVEVRFEPGTGLYIGYYVYSSVMSNL